MKPSHAANDNLIEQTRNLWQPRLGRDLSREDARQITENVTGFFALLAEWSRTEMPSPANDTGQPAAVRRPARRTMNAETIAKALGGRKPATTGWRVVLPMTIARRACRSVTWTAARCLVRCHAGCEQKQRDRCSSFARPVDAALVASVTQSAPRTVATSQTDRDNAKRTEAALAIWQSAMPALGTLVETYLASRGLHLPAPPTLRFHTGLKHPSGRIWPSMVALVTRGSDGTPIAIHRTFLARDGAAKAPVDPQKMMFGPCRGGAVQLATPNGVLMVGEGIETCLAAMLATGNAAWAALSTSGLRTLDLPDAVRDVIVLADGDDPGEAAARDCARRWKRDGRRVRVARPPQGMDFNDLLVSSPPHIEEGAR